MQKLFFVVVLICLSFFLVFNASAQTEVVYPSLPGTATPQEIIEEEGLAQADIFPLFMAYIFRLLLFVSLFAVLGVVVYGGVVFFLSSGNPLRTKIARDWILSAIQGALVIFSSYALLFALDSQLVLFQLREVEKGKDIKDVELGWEIKNTYFQIPFGLLIEDAILNDTAKNKLYDVLHATESAESSAESIYQKSKELLSIIESCPVGMQCGGGATLSFLDPTSDLDLQVLGARLPGQQETNVPKKSPAEVFDEVDSWSGGDRWMRGTYPQLKEPSDVDTITGADPGPLAGFKDQPPGGETREGETGEEETGEGETGEGEKGEGEIPLEEDLKEEETPEENLCCPPCPNISSAVQAKISEIKSEMNIFSSKLDTLYETKQPVEEDLYQLFKTVMLKSLGENSVFGYNSLLLQRQYYGREEVIITTDTERKEIGRYVWDWKQWINNILYQVEVEEKIIEENDPLTFYLRTPDADKIIEDALFLAQEARASGIQDAGNFLGIQREIPPPPPDIGTDLYSPVSPDITRITSPYGMRYDPFTGEWVMHYGVDFAGPRNTPVYASEEGEVVFSGWAGSNGYGNLLVLYHKATEKNELNQDVVTYYGHLLEGSLKVEKGDRVRRGDHIAGIGTTGRSTGYHLHYETRVNTAYPFILHTGDQVNPAPYVNTDQWAKRFSPFAKTEDNLLSFSFPEKKSPIFADAQTPEIVFENFLENNPNATPEEISKMLEDLGITEDPSESFNLQGVEVRTPADYLTCGMEIPVGETFEITWKHLSKLADEIDNYISEGNRLLEQQAVMNALASSCGCPCSGECCDCDPPYCGGCVLTCNLDAIRSAHSDVAKTRERLKEVAATIRLLTEGLFIRQTEDICHFLNEEIRDEEEKNLCTNGGEKLITKHELLTRKLNYSRSAFDNCMTRPENMESVLSGRSTGKVPLFGPLVEKRDIPRYTKTKKDGALINTSKFNWFCCSEEGF